MMQRNSTARAIFTTLCLTIALPTAAGNKPVIPTTLTYQGTKYVNCRPNPDYPFAVGQKLVTLKGTVGEEYGTRSLPWWAATVGDKALFNPVTKDLIHNYSGMAGKRVEITGYAGSGEIKVQYFLDKTMKTVPFPKAFYIHRIAGWTNVCGYAVQEDTGKVSDKLTYFWVKEP